MARKAVGLPRARHLWVIGAALALASCGGDGGSSATPSPSPTPTPPGGGTTITITSTGTSPRDVTVAVGSRVTFVNNDSRPHEMNSDPHPTHGDCPEIDVGFIAAGQSRQTQNLVTARACGYHDHNQPTVISLQGTIRIQ